MKEVRLVQKVNIPNYNQPTAGLKAAVGVTIDFSGLELLSESDTPTRWLEGLEARTPSCAPLTTYGSGCGPSDENTFSRKKPLTFTQPKSIKTRFDVGCSTWDGKTLEEFREYALQVSQEKMFHAIADEIWTGANARAEAPDFLNRYLALTGDSPSPLVKMNGDTPVSLVAGIALLERYLNCTSGQGIIHVPDLLMTPILNQNVALPDASNRLFSAMGHQFVSDCGYDGSGPASRAAGPSTPAAGQYWLYGTGPMVIKAGVTIPQMNIDALQNDMDVSVHGAFIYIWGCAHGAVLVDMEP